MNSLQDCKENIYTKISEESLPSDKMIQTLEETPATVEATVSGKIPEWLSGVYLRNGPGKFEVGDQKMNHFFDGFALMHKFDIADGKVSYSSRFLRGEAYVQATEQRRLVYSGFGTVALPDPCKNIFSRFFSYFMPPAVSDNCNVNYMKAGEDFYALTEGPKIVKIDPKDLNTIRASSADDYTAVNVVTAHPHYGEDGTIYNMGSSFGLRAYYKIIQFDSDCGDHLQQNAKVLCNIPASSSLYPSYYHSFGMTENYLVFIEQPLTIDILKVLSANYSGRDFAACMHYDESKAAKFYLIRRDDGTILSQTYTSDAFFFFHNINAYEDDGHLVLDICCYNDISIVKETYLDHLEKGKFPNPKSLPKRFVLPLDKLISDRQKEDGNIVTLNYTKAVAHLQTDGSVHCIPEVLSDKCMELPRINYSSYNGKKYQYFYASSSASDRLLKVDIFNKTTKEWRPTFAFTSEPVFVSRPGGEAEDDGVVLCSVIDLDGPGRPPYLVVLDAASFTEIARAELPVDVPYGIHGIFIPRK